tara:strand:- start:84 stop:782 length:699 start_codon:yes stop_codon:yes gene_type:complete
MDEQQANEWIGDIRLRSIDRHRRVQEIVKWNFLERLFEDFLYFSSTWDSDLSFVLSGKSGNTVKRKYSRFIYNSASWSFNSYRTKTYTKTKDHQQSPQMFGEFLLDTTNTEIREKIGLPEDVPDYSLDANLFFKSVRKSFDTILTDPTTNNKMKNCSGIDSSDCDKITVEYKYRKFDIDLYNKYTGSLLTEEEYNDLFTYAYGYHEWQILKYNAIPDPNRSTSVENIGPLGF